MTETPSSAIPDPVSEGGTLLRNGLIWAIFCRPGHDPIELEPDVVTYRLATGTFPSPYAEMEGWGWFHFDIVHTLSRAQIENIPSLHEEVRQVLTNLERSIRLDNEGDTVFGALPAFDDTTTDDDRNVSTWRFALQPDLLTTTRRHPIPALGVVYHELRRGIIPRSPAQVVDRALLEFADTLRRDFARLDDQLDRAEDVLLMLDRDTDLRRVNGLLGLVRRRATELRRVLAPVDRIFRDEELELPEWAEDDLRDRSQRQVHAALDDLLALQDRARSLQDELMANQAEDTNRQLYLVSVGTTLMLPATFVTGFFGMNTGGMFLTNGSWGTVEAGGICFVIMLGTWMLLKITRLL
ncbi:MULTISPECIES: CorA family divalent cation transporter [Acetobacter]|uniref:Magnesium transporter n=1 Tax=Acetobacter thailandicus TaxID=1502842 RepID=A0ABT3QGM0_9PROT|nr:MULTISPECIES: CorA family divalent cation transporter [Acetobacter]MBS0960916.1 magnesium transporter [Acetobacter thailandicus]MBS0980961.1 magnesium transporter [Acetobacter thailandicus]MBS0986649.1 magnesium transporter [Acetobacter thailandicus]MBS1002858.1 magnesium transporter [Acetobacter thailandicus]MCX2564436.1 magnesium transporter [Acetobacter thailandicus]